MEEMIAALLPQVAGLVVMVAAGLIARAYRAVAGEAMDKNAREALHSALETAADIVVAKGLSESESLGAVINYAKQSTPGALGRLSPPETVLMDLAMSKIIKAQKGTN